MIEADGAAGTAGVVSGPPSVRPPPGPLALRRPRFDEEKTR